MSNTETTEAKIPREGTILETFTLDNGDELRLIQSETGPTWRNKTNEVVRNPHTPLKVEKLDAETKERLRDAEHTTKAATNRRLSK